MPPVMAPRAYEAIRWRLPLHFFAGGRSDPVGQSVTLGHSTLGHSTFGHDSAGLSTLRGLGHWICLGQGSGISIWYSL